jgi:hypothetical protein
MADLYISPDDKHFRSKHAMYIKGKVVPMLAVKVDEGVEV